MTTKQKIELRLSTVRSRLNEIAGLEGEAFTDEIREEAANLEKEFGDLEVRHRAAILSEGEEEAAAVGLFPDGTTDSDGAEVRALLGRVTLADYLQPALGGVGLSGPARELADALGVPAAGKGGGIAVPWRVLEDRVFTTTTQNDGPEAQRPILQRLFGPGIMDALGVRMDTVPVGKTEWPLFSTGVAPDQAKETDAAATPVAATFTFANLKPKRITGQYELTHEEIASVADIEGALRRDLADAVKSKMSDIILNGTAPNTQNPQRIEGFISELTGVDDTTEADASRYGSLHAEAVDGVHASRETEVTSVIGVDTYQHAAGVYITGSGEAGSELLMRRGGGCMASTYIPDKVSMVQQAILHASGPNGGAMRGDSVAAMWPTLEIVRDIYSKASQGIVLTWVGLWDAKVALRADAYKLRGIHIG